MYLKCLNNDQICLIDFEHFRTNKNISNRIKQTVFEQTVFEQTKTFRTNVNEHFWNSGISNERERTFIETVGFRTNVNEHQLIFHSNIWNERTNVHERTVHGWPYSWVTVDNFWHNKTLKTSLVFVLVILGSSSYLLPATLWHLCFSSNCMYRTLH